MKQAVAELLTIFNDLESKRDGSFDDIIAQLPKEVEMHGTGILRDHLHDLSTEVHYRGFSLTVRATTDLRSFNVYPGTICYLSDDYKYTYANDGVHIHSANDSTDTPDQGTCEFISKLIQRIIEVY